MSVSNHKLIRDYLNKHLDGRSVDEIAAFLVKKPDVIRIGLSTMPDVYIDRWEGPYRGQYRAVWCTVEVPENCPKPTSKRKANEQSVRMAG